MLHQQDTKGYFLSPQMEERQKLKNENLFHVREGLAFLSAIGTCLSGHRHQLVR